jgi:hypothetical protein
LAKKIKRTSHAATIMHNHPHMTLEPPQNGYETILATQTRLDQVVLNLNQQRNTLQQSEASVREKIVNLIHQQRSLISSSTTTDRSNERQQQSIDLQVQKQRLAKAERAIRDKLDLLVEDETQLLHAFRALEDRIVLDKAMKANQVEEQQRQEEARARSAMITRLIEEQSRAVRQLQQEEDDEQKRKEQPGESKTSTTTTKKKNTQHQSNPIDDGCSVCLIPVRFPVNATTVSFRQLTMYFFSCFTGPRTIAFLD